MDDLGGSSGTSHKSLKTYFHTIHREGLSKKKQDTKITKKSKCKKTRLLLPHLLFLDFR